MQISREVIPKPADNITLGVQVIHVGGDQRLSLLERGKHFLKEQDQWRNIAELTPGMLHNPTGMLNPDN